MIDLSTIAPKAPAELKREHQLTKQKRAARRLYDQAVARMAGKLFNAQASAALGMYKMVTYSKGSRGGVETKIITDEAEMMKLLQFGQQGEDYFLIVGAVPDWRAADAMLNRTLGKAVENLIVDTPETFSLRRLAAERDAANVPAVIEGTTIDVTENA